MTVVKNDCSDDERTTTEVTATTITTPLIVLHNSLDHLQTGN